LTSSLHHNQLPPNPLRNLRNNGVSGSESLCKVGRIQSEAKPIILRRSLPLSHLIAARWETEQAAGLQGVRLKWTALHDTNVRLLQLFLNSVRRKKKLHLTVIKDRVVDIE